MSRDEVVVAERDGGGEGPGQTGFSAGALNLFSAENRELFQHKMFSPYDSVRAGVYAYGAIRGLVAASPNAQFVLPKAVFIAAGVGAADSFIDRQFFPKVDRKVPSVVADFGAVGLLYTPQPVWLKAAEMVAVHTIGRFLDSKI